MKLIELFHLKPKDEHICVEEPMPPAEALTTAIAILTGNDLEVADTLKRCLQDTDKFFSERGEILERRGLKYSEDARPWLCVIAAVEAGMEKGYLSELNSDCAASEFSDALQRVLVATGIVFSTEKLGFDTQTGLDAWVRRFNEYAGQSGITLYFVDLYGDSRVFGVAHIADYAEAAEIAGYAGVRITSRPD